MPCPYFEPTRVATSPQFANARLPLIDEYDGLCRAGKEPVQSPAELRFRCCNHGYSRGSCAQFPVLDTRSGLRYDVLSRTDSTLHVLYIEEQDYSPLRWHPVRYAIETECLEPEMSDQCARAQLLAFCRSYLRRFVEDRNCEGHVDH